MGVKGFLQFIAKLRGAGSIYRCSQWENHTDRRTLSVRASFIEVTPIYTAADTVAATGAVVAAVATPAISPEKGQAVTGVIEFQRRPQRRTISARIEAWNVAQAAHEPVNPARDEPSVRS